MAPNLTACCMLLACFLNFAVPASADQSVVELVDELGSRDDDKRKGAVEDLGRVLSRHRDVDKTEMVLDAISRVLAYDGDEDVREAAAEALSALDDPIAIEALERASSEDGEDDVRDAARDSLRKLRKRSSKVARSRDIEAYRVYHEVRVWPTHNAAIRPPTPIPNRFDSSHLAVAQPISHQPNVIPPRPEHQTIRNAPLQRSIQRSPSPRYIHSIPSTIITAPRPMNSGMQRPEYSHARNVLEVYNNIDTARDFIPETHGDWRSAAARTHYAHGRSRPPLSVASRGASSGMSALAKRALIIPDALNAAHNIKTYGPVGGAVQTFADFSMPFLHLHDSMTRRHR